MMKFYIVLFFAVYVINGGCKQGIDYHAGNTFYIEYQTSNDSLQNILKEISSGKLAYLGTDKQIQILPLNYMTEVHSDAHYFRILEELPIHPPEKTIKYEILFNDKMTNDSIAYVLTKYQYQGNEWIKKSTLGQIKVFDYLSERDKSLRIIKNIVAPKVFKTIVIDSFD